MEAASKIRVVIDYEKLSEDLQTQVKELNTEKISEIGGAKFEE